MAENVSAPCNHDHGVLDPTYYTHPLSISVMFFPTIIANLVRANCNFRNLLNLHFPVHITKTPMMQQWSLSQDYRAISLLS